MLKKVNLSCIFLSSMHMFSLQDLTCDGEYKSELCHTETSSMMGATSASGIFIGSFYVTMIILLDCDLWSLMFAGYSSDGRSSVHSGSLDAECYLRRKKKKSLMNMPRTLAFCHLALLWVREAITLADLLRWTRGILGYFYPLGKFWYCWLTAHQSGLTIHKILIVYHTGNSSWFIKISIAWICA